LALLHLHQRLWLELDFHVFYYMLGNSIVVVVSYGEAALVSSLVGLWATPSLT
jgi:hypothetical protein